MKHFFTNPQCTSSRRRYITQVDVYPATFCVQKILTFSTNQEIELESPRVIGTPVHPLSAFQFVKKSLLIDSELKFPHSFFWPISITSRTSSAPKEAILSDRPLVSSKSRVIYNTSLDGH
jgi:hypothetical protein